MSVSSLRQKDKLFVWVRAGGRCQYPGCPELLWRDDLSLAQMNRAYLAHIYGDRPGGPRYREGISERLAKDPSNFMLLCDTHHRLVDVEDEAGHPPESLLKFKQDHEEKIERVTSIPTQHKTHIVLFGSKIGEHSGLVCFDQARQAVVENRRWPQTGRGIRVGVPDAPFEDRDPAYWTLVRASIDQELGRTVHAGFGPAGKEIGHLSVFALAPMPALVYFGKALGDIVAADVYQRHRGHEDWTWREPCPKGFDYQVRESVSTDGGATVADHVAIAVAISADVPDESIRRALDDTVPIYRLSVSDFSTRVICSPNQVSLFGQRWRQLLARIQHIHGPDVRISLFPSMPVSVAVQLGRELLPKGDPPIAVFDKQRGTGFVYALTV